LTGLPLRTATALIARVFAGRAAANEDLFDLPVSFNKYIYANGDPINNSDPSGLTANLMELNAGVQIQEVLIRVVGIGIGGALIYPALEEAGNRVRGTIWELMVLMKLRGSLPDEATRAMAEAKAKAEPKDHKGREAHHTVPMYLCGHEEQDKSMVSYSEHQQLHAGLSFMRVFIDKASDEAADTLGIPFTRRRTPAIQSLGQGQLGRTAIAGAIGSFYALTQSGGWGTPIIDVNFAKEAPRFISGHTNCVP
jgi:hypothetical protein